MEKRPAETGIRTGAEKERPRKIGRDENTHREMVRERELMGWRKEMERETDRDR